MGMPRFLELEILISIPLAFLLCTGAGGQALSTRKLELKVEKFQPTSFGFNVTVTVKNAGTKPLTLAEAAGAKGTLQSLDIQQWDEKRGWQPVGPCRDIAPISTLKLEPGDSLQNKVSIGDKAHGWRGSVCPGGVEHLGGRVRAILYYAYDSEEDFKKRNPKGRVDFVSRPVELPGSTSPIASRKPVASQFQCNSPKISSMNRSAPAPSPI
jgi:hypothetical protein